MINIKIAEATRCNSDLALYVTSPFDNKIVSVIRSFSSKFWNAEKKEWELPFNKLGKLVESLQDFDFEITGNYVDICKPKAAVPAGFEFKTKPFEHQIDGFNYGLNNDRWLLGDEQGLGKTKQVIDIAIAKKLQKGYKHCLIICGVNGLKWNWVNEVHTHSNEEAHILGQQLKGGKISIGSTADKLKDLINLDLISSYFLITNIESIRDKDIQEKITELCESKEIGIVAIDEIHKCKNAQSQQGKGILKIQPECRIAMSGTPLMNNPLDLYIILKWLGYERHTAYAYKSHYCEMGGYGGYEIVGYKNLDELQERLNEIMLRRLKKDVLDLPEKTYVDEYVEMSPKQLKIYNEVTMDIKANIDQIKMASNPLAELIRMRQATGYTGILSSKIQESAKLDRMEELVEEAIENGKKVVIFSNWTQMTDVIQERILKMGWAPLVITGQTKDEERQQIVWNFQNRENNPVIIGTVGAMGTGLTLTAGTVEIFMDEPWNRANKEQAEDRCHRVGTTQNITIYTLMCKNTIDERIHDLILRKGQLADALVDGKVASDKREVLEYLIG